MVLALENFIAYSIFAHVFLFLLLKLAGGAIVYVLVCVLMPIVCCDKVNL